MLAHGVQDDTLKQLLRFLGQPSTNFSPSSKLCAKILSNPKIGEGGLDLSIANGVWVNKKLKPLQSPYQEVLKTAYNAKCKCMDFENKRDRSAGKINSWAKKKTKGLIPSIVAAADLKDVLMVIANALYFKGTWSRQFKPILTQKKVFHLINGERVLVPFMTNSEEYLYGSFEVYKMIKLPYKCEGDLNLSMYIFLPHKKDGLQNLLQLFHSSDALFHGDFDLRYENFDELWIPKFKISCTFDPKDVMNLMGLTLPFEPENGEFSGIVEPRSDYYKNLYASKIFQQSFIEVDEKGTVAAAVTASRIIICEPKPKPSFVADNPFMFMIRDDTSKAVLFIGVLLNPFSK